MDQVAHRDFTSYLKIHLQWLLNYHYALLTPFYLQKMPFHTLTLNALLFIRTNKKT
jgi:hypothetical protein